MLALPFAPKIPEEKPLPEKTPSELVTPPLMLPLKIEIFVRELHKIAVPTADGAVEKMVKPLRSSVTLFALIVSASPALTVILLER